MVRIRPQNLSQLVEKHYQSLKSRLEEKFFRCWKYSLEEIIKAKPDKLDVIAEWSKSSGIDFEFMKNKYKYFSKKNKYGKYDAYKLADSLDITICPYCNINPIYTVMKGQKNFLRPEFDHFYDKATYPILALSFFNLIPSCHACNSSLKGSKQFDSKRNINPYQDSFDDLVSFNLKLKDASFYYSSNGFQIEFQTNNDKANLHIDDFKLVERYEKHKDIVLELIQKREMYPDSYIDDLLKTYEGTFFKNREDLLRLVTGSYVSDEEIGKRPLSKLIKDISRDLDY